MWHVPVPARAIFRARGPALRASLTISPLFALAIVANAATAATPGKVYFFATREACAASGAFTRQECVAAFNNAAAQLQDRAPRFASRGECRARFQLCEIRRQPAGGDALAYAEAESMAFTPVALGVEMVATARGAEAAPTLAVETSARLFPKFPVRQVYEAQAPEPQPETNPLEGRTAILPSDHFEPFPRSQPMDVRATFSPFALGALDEAASSSAARESPAERRARLKSAPFIE
jgi:uncharacterized protein YgiB involved in biofilm formation